MKIALIGYGKMGQLIDRLSHQQKHTIISKIDPKQTLNKIDINSIKDADVCIDFSHPTTVVDNIKQVAALKKNLVVGTTGWYDQIDTVKEIIRQSNTGFLFAPNFSMGMYLFLQIVEEAASLINFHPEYDVAAYEMHHNQKADAPSGAAKYIAEKILSNVKRKTKIVYNLGDRKAKPEEIHFSSLRCGNIPGTHTVIMDSPADTITLTHQARTREGFALGAIKAAEWLHGKKGFYTLQDMMGDYHA